MSDYSVGHVIQNKENKKDLEEIPDAVRSDMNFVTAGTIDTVLENALCGNDNFMHIPHETVARAELRQ